MSEKETRKKDEPESAPPKTWEEWAERWRASREYAWETYRARWGTSNELTRATVTTAQLALRTAVLINGGAAVAVLALVGHLWTSEPRDANAIQELLNALQQFVIGVLLAGGATLTAYFTQLAYETTFNIDRKDWKIGWWVIGLIFHLASIALVIVAFWYFWIGIQTASGAFA